MAYLIWVVLQFSDAEWTLPFIIIFVLYNTRKREVELPDMTWILVEYFNSAEGPSLHSEGELINKHNSTESSLIYLIKWPQINSVSWDYSWRLLSWTKDSCPENELTTTMRSYIDITANNEQASHRHGNIGELIIRSMGSDFHLLSLKSVFNVDFHCGAAHNFTDKTQL